MERARFAQPTGISSPMDDRPRRCARWWRACRGLPSRGKILDRRADEKKGQHLLLVTPGARSARGTGAMGNFLDAPICEKETEVGEDTTKNISYGLSAMQVDATHARRGSLAGCWQGLRAGRLHGCSHRASLFFCRRAGARRWRTTTCSSSACRMCARSGLLNPSLLHPAAERRACARVLARGRYQI